MIWRCAVCWSVKTLTARGEVVSHQFYTAGGSEPSVSDSEVRLVGGIENVDISAIALFDGRGAGISTGRRRSGKRHSGTVGTLLAYSVSEAEDEKSVTVVELLEKGRAPVIRALPLAPLRRVRKLTGTLEEILNETPEEYRHDYVSITLTDELEAYQPKERLEEQFDHTLEIRVDNARTRKILSFAEEGESLEPYAAFCRFFAEMNGRDLTEQEKKVLGEVIRAGQEEIQ